MKIGIVTLARGENYGGQLQNLAVKLSLESMGAEAVTILDKTTNGVKITQRKTKISRLSPRRIANSMRVRIKRKYSLKNQRDSLFRSIINKKTDAPNFRALRSRRTEAFNSFFDNNIGSADFTLDIDKAPDSRINSFDFFCCGSDQVWNPVYPETSGIKFLTFTERNKRITFAPSFGISELPGYVKPKYAEWLAGFENLSVREKSGADLIRELAGKDAFVMCDPTLMISREQWSSFGSRPDFMPDKPYIVTYFLGNESNRYRRFIDCLAKERDLEVVNLFDIREGEYFFAGPAQFIYLIEHSRIVCSDSFHAAVFSIIFHKDFVVFDRIEDGKSMGSRLKNLLDTFGLSDRSFDFISKIGFTPADFSGTDDIIASLRDSAFAFLRKSIEDNKKL